MRLYQIIGPGVNSALLVANLVVFFESNLGLLTVNGAAANVFAVSSNLKGKLHRCKPIISHREFKRTVLAIPEMRIQLGSSNFVDKFTPLGFLSFNIERAIHLLLIDKMI